MTPHDPLGLYLHLPFCRVRCTYCAFAVSTDRKLEGAYNNALLAELRLRHLPDRPVDSMFLGGGTPSLSALVGLRRISAEIRNLYDVLPDAEFTIEANPEDVTVDAVDGWRELGVNRLSIGVQSLSDDELYPLGRGHGSSMAVAALGLAVDAGFRTSADLILGLPGQSLESFMASLRSVLGSGVGHVSLYILDLEPGSFLETQVRAGRTNLPDDELTEAMYLGAVRAAEEAGLHQYEVSNFAREGEESRHNLKYWNRLPYLGLGLGAHSFLENMRLANSREIGEYTSALLAGRDAIVFREELTAENERHETLFLGLRQAAGLRYADVVAMCGMEGERWVNRGVEEGWLKRSGERVAFTSAGFLLSNEYISQLF
ncbi:MAG TPA: radical SAM family heme chaperone HemW [Thermoanaerobaculia bacterium]|nr:radical SAM family heme chaperone HemW [Thermoanaerobaculia bacterium]